MIRFSSPITTSRLRRPMSVSTMHTFFPKRASAVPMLADVVVLPTPPLPEVMTIASPMPRSLSPVDVAAGPYPVQIGNLVDLHQAVVQIGEFHERLLQAAFFRRPADDAGDAKLRRLHVARGDDGVLPAVCPRMGDAAQRTDHVDVAGGGDGAPGVDVADEQQVAVVIQRLPGTHDAAHQFQPAGI